MPGGENCYRRALVEIALDRGAAQEPVHFAFRSRGGHGSGHAWLGGATDEGGAPTAPPPGGYDAYFVL
jgi:hypothetical protein